MPITKQEFINSNQYIRKGMKNLSDKDLKFMADLGSGRINPEQNLMEIKQVVYHMKYGMSLRELMGLIKAFKTLQKLPN